MPRILNPVVLVLDALPALCRDAQLASYVQAVFSSVEGCRCAHLLTRVLLLCCMHGFVQGEGW